MEFFNRAKAVRLRSHHGKYLVAEEDEETIKQSRRGSSLCARWTVEFIPYCTHLIRLKSCYGKYLTASAEPLLLDFTGKKVVQAMSTSSKEETSIEWEPLTVGYQVKLGTRSGKFLRANAATLPWRNSITHDIPHRMATQGLVLWDVDLLEILESGSIPHYISPATSISSSFSDDLLGSERRNSNFSLPSVLSSRADPVDDQGAMEIFQRAKSVRLRSHHEKYLLADEDQENVIQDRHGTIKNAKWTVEMVNNSNVIRLKSCYGKYLTASNMPFLLGMQGKKVLQTLPRRLDSSVEWEPIREGAHVRLKTRYGQYLRANGGLPPWRNSITHDIPHRTSTQDWVLWEVDITEIRTQDSSNPPPLQSPPSTRQFEATPPEPDSPMSSMSSSTMSSPRFSRIDSDDSFVGVPVKNEGRMIYYRVANEDGEIKESDELSFNFKGSTVDELRQKLEMETGMNDILVCFLNPLNGKLYPLRLHLPPNNANMHVVVVPSSGKGAPNIMQLVDPPAGRIP